MEKCIIIMDKQKYIIVKTDDINAIKELFSESEIVKKCFVEELKYHYKVNVIGSNSTFYLSKNSVIIIDDIYVKA